MLRQLGMGEDWKGGKHRVRKPIKAFSSAFLTSVKTLEMISDRQANICAKCWWNIKVLAFVVAYAFLK